MAKVHVIVEVFSGVVDAVHVYGGENLTGSIGKLKAVRRRVAFKRGVARAELFPSVEIIEAVPANIPPEAMKEAEGAYGKLELPKYEVVEFRGDVAVNVLFTDKTQKEAAEITHMLNVGMLQERRDQGFHVEMRAQASDPKGKRSA